MIKVSIKEILKMDVGILNKYFLVTLILVLLTVVGYTSYALFSHEEVSSTGIRLKYTGEIELPQSEGNLANNWKEKTENETKYLAIYTLDNVNFPGTYNYDGTTYTLNETIAVSEQENANVLLAEYKNGSNYIAIFGQNGGVIAPENSSRLFSLVYASGSLITSNLITIDLSNLDTSNVTNMQAMFFWLVKIITLDLTSFDTSKVTTMEYMFGNSNSLTTVIVGCSWTTENADITNMFNGSSKISTVTKVCNE